MCIYIAWQPYVLYFHYELFFCKIDTNYTKKFNVDVIINHSANKLIFSKVAGKASALTNVFGY